MSDAETIKTVPTEQRAAVVAAPCCGTRKQAACCGKREKASCCGPEATATGRCGCQ